MEVMAWWTAAEPVAQAFSTRVAGLNRNPSLACRTIEAVKSCGLKPGVEVAEQDLVDVLGRDPGVGQRLVRDPDDQAFQGLVVELSEGRMRPTHDAGGHEGVLDPAWF